MRRCLTDEQIDRLAGGAPSAGLTHVARCESCRQRLEAARQNALLLEELAELDRSREQVRRLLESGSRSAPGGGARSA